MVTKSFSKSLKKFAEEGAVIFKSTTMQAGEAYVCKATVEVEVTVGPSFCPVRGLNRSARRCSQVVVFIVLDIAFRYVESSFSTHQNTY
jgi:hypothetical protein